jgi:hypothetical protein
MKNKDFAALAQRLLPDSPGFAVKAPLMFIPPVKHTLRGLCFESHSHEAGLFYVWVFFLPLFVPRKHVSFEFGKRIGGDRWNADAPNLVYELGGALKREAFPFLLPIESPHDVAQAATSLRLPQNPHVQQAIAYALARAGDASKAVAQLDALLALLDVKIPWQLEMAERANALKSQLLSDAASAQKQLEAWEVESVRNLGLEKFR